VIDLTDGAALPDKDLKFVLSNQNLFFRRKDATIITNHLRTTSCTRALVILGQPCVLGMLLETDFRT
jgi:hypothetical protein